ncbi:hypothetical protein OIU85_005750 [Salix viminalis]|uniref:PHD-type domain-containing protein n=1 Tax=Salix viminalis TaxID=40686 RepID=A0A9Q0PJJ7_SALVM|nr:hypothetical protein OIU85_005750 [Salix viminalis]
MEEGRRSGDPSGYIVKNRSSSGCLIVRKKGNDGVGGAGPSGSHKVFDSKKVKKRPRVEYSDSGSSDGLLMPPRRRVGSETLRACNGLSGYEESYIGRKRSRGEDTRRNEAGLIGRNGGDLTERKRNKLDMSKLDQYDGNDLEMLSQQFDDGGIEGRGCFRSMMAGRSGIAREYESGSSRHAVIDIRKSSYFERSSDPGQGGDRVGALSSLSLLRDSYDSDKPIRVQGKNGVLKVMVNKKKKFGGSLNSYDRPEAKGNREVLRAEESVKKNVPIRPPVYSDPKSVDKAGSVFRTEKITMNTKKSVSTKIGKVSDRDSEDSETLLKSGPKKIEAHNPMKTPLATKKSKDLDMDSDDSDTSLKLVPKDEGACKSVKGTSSEGEKTPYNQHPETRIKEGKVKRGSGTEKQKLRERIREMLLNSGWTIDYRPRRNRDYLDAVYINPTGTAYWSIIKAYDALLKQLDEVEAKSRGDGSPFTPLSNEVLGQLTRKTKKKIEKEMKRNKRDISDSEDARETTVRKSSTGCDEESLDSGGHEEKLSSLIKQGGKSLKSRTSGNGSVSINSISESSTHHLHDGTQKPSSGSNSLQGSKSRKLGRCTLLARNSNEGTLLDSDGFIPYSGKRTLLSWLIDCGTVQLSEKVCYMNRRRTKVMLEGWLTRDGIHCGCCSKILTVSKFEIHAGSKLRQPFQNICLDSGISLLDCQIEAWNRQESVKRLGFQAVDIDGNDPNDDTCGLCGDGGDLMCCDGCPSTFHQSCLDIKMLPPGDWYCPNCTCKFCGIVSDKNAQGDDTTVSKLLTCSLCEKKYHSSCMQEFDALSIDTNSPFPRFCEKKCRELFEKLQKYLGVKNELDSGFSWSLIHRADADSDTSSQGLPQRAECNSKLAVSLSVMDECFLPVVDRRSGVNLIQNVLYNCGSNSNRLNFGGFYAVILERGDEIISAASIRFHGTRLAEMPFIGTRHMYRRQGMCRRLFYAIESTLCSLKVEKLIIPAVSELMHTWTEVFGFTTLNELLKQELKSMNMLVFPGIDMLQKELRQENIDGRRSTSIGFGANQMEYEEDSELLVLIPNALMFPQTMSLQMNGSLDVSHGLKSAASLKEETIQANSKSEDKLVQSAVDKKRECASNTPHDVHEMVKSKSDSPVEDTSLTCFKGDVAAMGTDTQLPGASLGDVSVMSGSLDASCELKDTAPFDGTSSAESESEGKIPGPASRKILNASGVSQEENKSDMASPAKDSDQSCKVDEVNLVHALNLDGSVSEELKVSKSVEESGCADSQSEYKFVEITLKMETKPQSDSSVDNNNLSCNGGDLGDAPTGSVNMVNEISGISVSGFSGTEENNMQIEANPNNEIGHERGIKLDVVPEAVSNGTVPA